ncbi:hypothetical protein ES708_06631 [subsurface metagenome]
MIEEQTEYNASSIVYGTHRAKVGQRVAIPNRKVLKLAFVLQRINLAVGDVFFVIARTFDNVELIKQKLCDASELAGTPEWYELEFSSPPTINDEVAIYVEYPGGDSSNHILVHYQNANVKHNGYNEHYREVLGLCWWEEDNWDCAYKYWYETIGAGAVVYSIEQLCQDGGLFFGDATITRGGQKLIIPNRKITHLGFWIWKLGAPTGDITFGIRRVSDDGLICSKVWGDASALQGAAAYEEVEFDTPPTINEEVRVYAEFLNGNATDRAALNIQKSDVKGNEHLTYYPEGAWSDFYTDRDARYRMKNLLVILAPTVTTNLATALSAIAATPNGKLDSDGGEACECGFEWGLDTSYGTTTSPQSKTTGETFSQVIGGLFPNTVYHFRAFATNSVGTSHGTDRTFTTALIISRAHALAREEL